MENGFGRGGDWGGVMGTALFLMALFRAELYRVGGVSSRGNITTGGIHLAFTKESV
jgi:hypothetical protein